MADLVTVVQLYREALDEVRGGQHGVRDGDPPLLRVMVLALRCISASDCSSAGPPKEGNSTSMT